MNPISDKELSDWTTISLVPQAFGLMLLNTFVEIRRWQNLQITI